MWIVTTQWRAQACGYAGDPNARTPRLDELAAESVNYTQAVTPHPFGPFARAALLTGVPSPANGVRDYFDPLPTEARTIAHELRARGYSTAFFGKWGVGKRDVRVPLVGEEAAKVIVPAEARGGFEFWEGFEGGFLLNDPWLHGTELPEPVGVAGYQSDVVCQRAAEWIGARETGDRRQETGRAPCFVVVSLEAPHPPYGASAAGVARRDRCSLILPANVLRGGEGEAKAREELAGYYAHIEATDRAIGRLIAVVDADATRRGRRVPVAVFTSVHGDMHGAHGLFRKGWPYEESVRVPLLVRGAPEEGEGRIDSRPVSLVDLRRMTLAWAEGRRESGDRRRETGDGRQAPSLSRGNGEPMPGGGSLISMPSVVNLPHQCDRVWYGVRTATRKLVLNADGTPWLFFDLEADPGEMNNLVNDPVRAREMAELREHCAAEAGP